MVKRGSCPPGSRTRLTATAIQPPAATTVVAATFAVILTESGVRLAARSVVVVEFPKRSLSSSHRSPPWQFWLASELKVLPFIVVPRSGAGRWLARPSLPHWQDVARPVGSVRPNTSSVGGQGQRPMRQRVKKPSTSGGAGIGLNADSEADNAERGWVVARTNVVSGSGRTLMRRSPEQPLRSRSQPPSFLFLPRGSERPGTDLT